MLKRIRLLGLLVAALVLPAHLKSANPDGSTAEAGNAEAARLYRESNDFVSGMAEDEYSYSYLQFFWKRAQSNIDRIRRVYPGSPTALAMARGELKVGPFDLDYFRDRVLYNLEVKRIAAFDDVNCAIFLYDRDEARNDPIRDQALESIIEVLARRQRWGEAMKFPVLSAHRPILLGTIFRIAAFFDQQDIVKRLSTDISPAERKASGFDPILAEAQALLGKPRSDLYKFVADHPTGAVRNAALRGIVEREVLIRRMEAGRVPPGKTIQTVHLDVQNLSLRDNVPAVAARLFLRDPDGAAQELEVYAAALGTPPGPGALVDAHVAYMQFLADARRLEAIESYPGDSGVTGPTKVACELKAIELFAEAGRMDDAERLRNAYSTRGEAAGNQAALAEFRGQMDATDPQLIARVKTFSSLPITDPCVLAVAIMDWSLTPNRSQRGAPAWDAVVARVAGGFDNLPKPKSAEVGTAASTLKPY